MLAQLTLRQLKTALEDTQRLPQSLFAEADSPANWQRAREDARYKPFWKDAENRAAQWLQSPVSPPLFSEFTLFGDTGDRSIFQEKRDQHHIGLHLFGMLAMADNNPDWITGLNNAIWSICDEYTWVLPAHVGLFRNDYPNGIWDQPTPPRESVDLYAAVIGFTLAEIVHLHCDRLHPWVVHRAKKEIDRRILQVYFNSAVPQNWELKTNNWPAVCSSCIGASAIYLIEDSEMLAGMLWRVIGVLRNFIAGFDEQGSTPEGPGYCQYGFSNFVYFSELLKARTHGRISLLTDEKIERIAAFLHMCLLSGGKTINFSDNGDETRLNAGLMDRLRQYAPSLPMLPDDYRMNPSLSWLDSTRLMLWSASVDTPTADKAQAGIEEQIYEGNQWVISKVRRADGRLVAFAAKGGHNEEPHNHNDLGHFILHVDGVSILADIGLGIYTRQYFQPLHRYEMINTGSHGHSVPVVDGCRQGCGAAYRTEMPHSRQTEEEVRVTFDMTRAYDCPKLNRLTREYRWRRSAHERPQLTIIDHSQFNRAPGSMQEVFISSVPPREIESGHIQLDSVTMRYDFGKWDFAVETVEADSPARTGNIFYRLVLNYRNPGEVIIAEFRFEISDAYSE